MRKLQRATAEAQRRPLLNLNQKEIIKQLAMISLQQYKICKKMLNPEKDPKAERQKSQKRTPT